MQLKTYSDFKRQLAGISAGTVLSPDSFSPQTKMASDTSIRNKACGSKRNFLFEGGNGAAENSSHVIGNSLSSSNHSSRKRMKSSDRLSPLSLPRNDTDITANGNSCNNSVISSSNSSINSNTINNGDAANQAMNNNVPFAANTWWKKGNEQLRDLMSTSIASASVLPPNMNISSDNSSYTSNSRNGINNNFVKMNSYQNTTRSPITDLGVPSPSPITRNSLAAATSTPVLSPATPGDQKPASWLKLLGEVASSGGNQHRGMQSPQHQMLQLQQQQQQQQQQGLQALRMQGNDRANVSVSNNPFLVGQSPVRFPTSLNNNRISRMAIQSRLPQGNMLDPSNFLSEGMNMTQLQLQQQQQQLYQQQQFHLQQQSLHPLAFSQANGQLFPNQAPFLQQRQNQAQRQQIQRPAAARGELKIHGIRASGDIGVAPLPTMERELDDSYQQDTSFGHGGIANGNANGVQKTISDGQKRKENIEIMDVNDLVFSDMVPMMPTSGSQSLKVEGFDGACVNVDDVDVGVGMGMGMDSIVVGNNNSSRNMAQSRSPSPPKNQSKPSSSPNQNPTLKDVKFRAYQAENWTEKFEELLRFREENGHCLVPNCHPENPALAQWTKRQRYQYKLKQDGKRSTITDERVRALDEAGFVWDSHKAVWAERLEELKDFKKRYKHCNVPSRYKPNHQLAIWVKRQRRQWKNKLDRLPNCMTDERQNALEAIGFVWDMKKGKRSPQNSPIKQHATQI